ncbi:CocE/NonD family hydrolase [Nucisporomicrobium flavum]|uniref:CocE/NonD family hydrolase n=1 Tax=Nucisporomicrobium flavum TaxID=2785915 RepID=UPI003C2C24D0
MKRTPGERLADRLWTRYAHLPAATSDYTVRRGVRIPMRDGVGLLADVLLPKGPASGTVLVTSPYGVNTVGSSMTGGLFARRGYRVVLVRCRGTFGSGGTFEPFMREVDDAADIVAWMREQPWFDGRFATHGYSYLGFTQWALLMDPPPELTTAIVACAPYDLVAAVHPGGAFLLSTFLEWSFVTTRQEQPILPRMASILAARGRIRRALAALPLADAAKELLNGKAPWYGEWISRRDLGDPWWEPADLTEALDRVRVPVLLQGGWQDGFLRQTTAAHARLTARGTGVALTIGPWTHAEGGAAGARILLPEALAWLDEHLAGSSTGHRAEPVKVFVTGAGWRNLPAWPPPTVEHTLHPGADRQLTPQPAGPTAVDTFTYDPTDPTPTYGGAFVTQVSPGITAGYVDDSALASRSDVLAFTSDPLATPLEVLGSPVAEMDHRSDNPFADLFVRVSEVDARGRSRNVTDGLVRLGPSTAAGVVRVELEPVAHRFARGSQIRLLVAGGSHPRWERNLGTGDDPATSTKLLPSHRTIHLSNSRLTLPVADPRATGQGPQIRGR